MLFSSRHTEAGTIPVTNDLDHAELQVDQVCSILDLKGIIGDL